MEKKINSNTSDSIGLSGAGARQYIRKSKEKIFFEKKERAHQEIKKYFEKMIVNDR